MSLDSVAQINITLDAVTNNPGGFGTAAAVHKFTTDQETAIGATPRFSVGPGDWRTVLTGFGVTSSDPLYVAVQSFFDQPLKPSLLWLVVAADFVAQVQAFTVTTAASVDYSIIADPQDGTTPITVTITAGGSPTPTTVRDALRVAWDADADAVALATSADVSTDGLALTATVAGAPILYAVVVGAGGEMTSLITQASSGFVEDFVTFDNAGRPDLFRT